MKVFPSTIQFLERSVVRVPALSAAAWAVAAIAFAQGAAPAAQAPSVQKFFEAGQFPQALQLITTTRQATAPGPADAYLAAHVYLKMNRAEQAKLEFSRLVAADDPVWRLIGESSIALVDRNLDLALQKTTEAQALLGAEPEMTSPTDDTPPVVARATEKFHAAYQTGLVRAAREDWQGSAEAFARAAELNPTFAYGQYYAGMAYSRVKRPDLVVLHFERFLALAPSAPERPAVMSLLRTIRDS